MFTLSSVDKHKGTKMTDSMGERDPWIVLVERGIKIGGKKYLVQQIDNDDSTTELGNHNGLTQVIRVRNMHPEQMRDTMMHEVLHAILWNNGHDNDASHENIVECLACGLDAVFVDNPHLLKLWGE